MWTGLPDLFEGEVAIEIDVKDALIAPERADTYGRRIFPIKRVLVGDLNAPTIAVEEQNTSCTRNTVGAIIGEKVFVERIVLVGRLNHSASDGSRLIPRYMPFDQIRQYGATPVTRE